MDTKETTLAELIDAFVAADRPAPLGASALSRLAYWHGALGRTAWPPLPLTMWMLRSLRSLHAVACGPCGAKTPAARVRR